MIPRDQIVSALERVKMDNSGEKPRVAIALDSRLSEAAGYSDDSPAKPISRKKKNSRKRCHGESTSSRYKSNYEINRVGRMLKELVQENGNEPLKSIWAGFLFTQEWGVAN